MAQIRKPKPRPRERWITQPLQADQTEAFPSILGSIPSPKCFRSAFLGGTELDGERPAPRR